MMSLGYPTCQVETKGILLWGWSCEIRSQSSYHCRKLEPIVRDGRNALTKLIPKTELVVFRHRNQIQALDLAIEARELCQPL